MEVKLKMNTVRTLGVIVKALQRIGPDVIIQCTEVGFNLTCINSSLTTFCHCTVSRESFEMAVIIQDDNLIGPGYKVSCEVLAICLSYAESSGCNLVFSPSMITLMYSSPEPQTIIVKMYYEQVKVVQALHPELQEYPLIIRTMAQPWMDCLSKIVGVAEELTLSVEYGLVLLGLKGRSVRCRFGLPLVELYEIKGSIDTSVTLPFLEFKTVLNMAKHCNSLLTLYISEPGIPVVVMLPIQGIEQCKFIIATLEIGKDQDNFEMDDEKEEKKDEEDWEYPATSSSTEEF